MNTSRAANMVGRTLRDRYQVLELLGEGSTAFVYKARDLRLNRVVALKILLPQVRDTVYRRFMQEAMVVAQLQHPNIMMIFDRDEVEGMSFLVVEYVEGDTLTNFIPATPETVARLGRQIAQALHYAHERDIIHRDIKPANIKVTPDGQVKIMDLGLALPREAKRVTAEGMIIGTPAYLSPEQAQAQPLDRRTDIYSLGIVLFEMATGVLPFQEDDIPSLLLQHVREAPPSLRQYNADIPPALENVIHKALEKQPSRRFQTGELLAEALDAAMITAEVPTAPTSDAASPEVPPVRATQPTTSTGSSRRPLRIALADDHSILRRTLASFLSEQAQFIIAGEAGDGQAAIDIVVEQKPDVLLLDLNMPRKSGLEALPEIRAQSPSTKVLVLTGRDEDFYIMTALKLGAQGYVLKSAGEEDLVDAIRKVADGQLVLGSGVAEKVVRGMIGGTLNDDERRLMLCVAAGMDNDAIAERLNLPITEMFELLARTMNKLGAKDRYAAALQAIRSGYVLIDELQSF